MRTKIISDVENFICENQQLPELSKFEDGQKVPKEVEDLMPWEKVSAYLQWNGILGYTDELVEVFEWAGWKRP